MGIYVMTFVRVSMLSMLGLINHKANTANTVRSHGSGERHGERHGLVVFVIGLLTCRHWLVPCQVTKLPQSASFLHVCRTIQLAPANARWFPYR